MDLDNPPASLETRELLATLRADHSYPFLRAVRWLLFGGAIVYAIAGLFTTIELTSDAIGADARETIVTMGGPERGGGIFVAALFLLTVAFRVVLILATAEGIKLLLDLVRGQRHFARQQDELAGALAKPT